MSKKVIFMRKSSANPQTSVTRLYL